MLAFLLDDNQNRVDNIINLSITATVEIQPI